MKKFIFAGLIGAVAIGAMMTVEKSNDGEYEITDNGSPVSPQNGA